MSYNQLINGNDYKQWYNKKSDEQITYLIHIYLLNINEIILEMIHLAVNNCYRSVDSMFHCFEWDEIVMITNNHFPFWLANKIEEKYLLL